MLQLRTKTTLIEVAAGELKRADAQKKLAVEKQGYDVIDYNSQNYCCNIVISDLK